MTLRTTQKWQPSRDSLIWTTCFFMLIFLVHRYHKGTRGITIVTPPNRFGTNDSQLILMTPCVHIPTLQIFSMKIGRETTEREMYIGDRNENKSWDDPTHQPTSPPKRQVHIFTTPNFKPRCDIPGTRSKIPGHGKSTNQTKITVEKHYKEIRASPMPTKTRATADAWPNNGNSDQTYHTPTNTIYTQHQTQAQHRLCWPAHYWPNCVTHGIPTMCQYTQVEISDNNRLHTMRPQYQLWLR